MLVKGLIVDVDQCLSYYKAQTFKLIINNFFSWEHMRTTWTSEFILRQVMVPPEDFIKDLFYIFFCYVL